MPPQVGHGCMLPPREDMGPIWWCWGPADGSPRGRCTEPTESPHGHRGAGRNSDTTGQRANSQEPVLSGHYSHFMRRTWVWMALTAVAVLLIAAGGGFLYLYASNSPAAQV